MILVSLGCSASGEFRSCEANGHAGFAQKGFDIVCSAISELLRTAGKVLSDTGDISVAFEAGARGKMAFHLENAEMISERTAIRLVCIADFVRTGVSSVAKEYPECVKLEEFRTDF